jgi:hypothetical protein
MVLHAWFSGQHESRLGMSALGRTQTDVPSSLQQTVLPLHASVAPQHSWPPLLFVVQTGVSFPQHCVELKQIASLSQQPGAAPAS